MTLFTGFNEVGEFGPDEEYEEGEEVSYVTLDLGNIEPTLVPTSTSYRLIVSRLITTRVPPLTTIEISGAGHAYAVSPAVWHCV
jgi:hypothetical protein